MQRKRTAAVPVPQVVEDAEVARRALARLEQAAGSGLLDQVTIVEIIDCVERGGHSLAGMLRRLIRDLGIDDDSPEITHLNAAIENARRLAISLQQLAATIDRSSVHLHQAPSGTSSRPAQTRRDPRR